ncbi:MAG: putative membrane protein, partial [Planctomycetota bacterium]
MASAPTAFALLEKRKAMRRIITDFFKGLVFVIPVVTTIYLVWLPVSKIDNLVDAKYPGLGLAIMLALIWGVGVVASNKLGSKLFGLVDRLMDSIPMLALLHGTIKDLITAFVGEKKKFDRPVIVDLMPSEGIQGLGFITRSDFEEPQLNGLVAVYLPQSYNIAGNLLLLP